MSLHVDHQHTQLKETMTMIKRIYPTVKMTGHRGSALVDCGVFGRLPIFIMPERENRDDWTAWWPGQPMPTNSLGGTRADVAWSKAIRTADYVALTAANTPRPGGDAKRRYIGVVELIAHSDSDITLGNLVAKAA
jgi:hypothetical protein